MNSVVHFEMPFDDRDRMTKFYELAFGWRTQKLGKDIGSYVLATTTETDDHGPEDPVQSMSDSFRRSPVGPISIRLSSSRWTTSRNRSRKQRRPGVKCSASRWRYPA